jgi:Do/DeqQ family serine protease
MIRRRILSRVLVAAAMLGTLAPPALGQPRAPQRSPAPAPDSQRLLRLLEDAFVSVADRATPSVVNVNVRMKREAAENPPSPETEERFREFFGPELFERFFRRRPPREEGRATGSGVIVDARGYILTNNHVVENATEIEVRLSDDRKFKATLVGRDARTDLAVLKLEDPGGPLPVAELGDSDRIRVGQWAVAIGNPFGLDRTVTVGIISATGRTHVGVATYEAFIQTDASINPGNSGGPLLNLDGRVVGINTAIVSSGQGIGFAIPINMARDIMTQLIARGRVVRGWLGVVIQDLTPELSASFGVKGDAGVLVADVMKGSPAEAAGLKPGDVIVDFAGSPIKDVPDLQKRVAGVEPGRPTPLVVMRDHKGVNLDVKIGEQPGDDADTGDDILGLSVEPLTPETARQNRLSARGGLLVTDVTPGSPGAAAGIKPGDAILEVNRRPVNDADALKQAVSALKPGESVPVYLQRGGGSNEYVMLTAPRP